MQKATAFLEKNIEWIALGLAGLWLLWLGWSYFIVAPVTVSIDGRPLKPGEADEVGQGEHTQLVQRINESKVPALGAVAVSGDFERLIKTEAPAPLAANIFYSPEARPPELLALMSNLSRGEMSPIVGPILEKEKRIAALPQVPAPRIIEILCERDQVVIPPPPQQQQQPDGMGGFIGGGVPGLPFQSVPGAGVPAPPPMPPPPGGNELFFNGRGGFTNPNFNNNFANPNVATNPNAVDKEFVTVFAKFDERQLEAAYQAAKIPSFVNQQPFGALKVYLAVQLVRQEKMADGSWANEKEIPPLAINAPPVDRKIATVQYLQWAEQSQEKILQPPFYQSLNNKWRYAPAKQVDLAAMQQVMIPPNADGATLYNMWKGLPPADALNFRNSLTPPQKKLLYDYEQEQKRLERKNKAQSNPGGGGRVPVYTPPTDRERSGGGVRRPGAYDAQDPRIFGQMLAQAGIDPRLDIERERMRGSGMTMRPGYGPGYRSGYVMPFTGSSNTNDPGLQQVVRPGQPGQPLEFDVWAHDETVEAGKIYRYRMRVIVKNPVYGSNENIVANVALAKILEIPAESDKSWSEWSSDVKVKPRVQFFLAGTMPNRDQARFQIYRWLNGKINKTPQAVVVGAGDMISTFDKANGVDFNTGWTVVDVRNTGGGDCRVTLVNNDGFQEVRTYKGDRDDKDHKELDQELARAAAANAQQGGMQPGVPTMPPSGGGIPAPMIRY